MTVLDSAPTPAAPALGYVCWKMMPLQLKCRNKQISQKRANKTPLHAVGNTGREIPLVRYVCAQVSHSDTQPTQPGQAKSFHPIIPSISQPRVNQTVEAFELWVACKILQLNVAHKKYAWKTKRKKGETRGKN